MNKKLARKIYNWSSLTNKWINNSYVFFGANKNQYIGAFDEQRRLLQEEGFFVSKYPVNMVNSLVFRSGCKSNMSGLIFLSSTSSNGIRSDLSSAFDSGSYSFIAVSFNLPWTTCLRKDFFNSLDLLDQKLVFDHLNRALLNCLLLSMTCILVSKY